MTKQKVCYILTGVLAAACAAACIAVGAGKAKRSSFPKQTVFNAASIQAEEKVTRVLVSTSEAVAVYNKDFTLDKVEQKPAVIGTVDLKKGTESMNLQNSDGSRKKTTMEKTFGKLNARNQWELLNELMQAKGCGSLYQTIQKDNTLKDVKDLSVWKQLGVKGKILSQSVAVQTEQKGKATVPTGFSASCEAESSGKIQIYTLQVQVTKDTAKEVKAE